jgi:hypothetical protein
MPDRLTRRLEARRLERLVHELEEELADSALGIDMTTAQLLKRLRARIIALREGHAGRFDGFMHKP